MNGIPQRPGIPQGGGAPGYSGPLVQQLQNIGKPLISKATQTTTQPGRFDPMQLLMMLFMMDVFKKKPPGMETVGQSGLPGQDFGIQAIMEILKGAMPQMGAGPTFPG